jgi:hypothetical protein
VVPVHQIGQQAADLAAHLVYNRKAFSRRVKAAEDGVGLLQVLLLEGCKTGIERSNAHGSILSIFKQTAIRAISSRQVAMMAHASSPVIGTRLQGPSWRLFHFFKRIIW